MSIQPITDDNFEFFTIETHPSKSYSSRLKRDANGAVLFFTGAHGALEEVLDNTGSIKVFAEQSPIEKEIMPLQTSSFSAFSDSSLEALRKQIVLNADSDKEAQLTTYLDVVNATTQSIRKQAKQEILRFKPTVNFSSNTLRKQNILNQLMPYYRSSYMTANFNYTNYNSLNFFSNTPLTGAFTVPSESVLMYPNPPGELISPGVSDSQYGHKSGQPFSFDFWVKPSYTVADGEDYKAGCVVHLTGAYAISIHSGSSKNHNGEPDKFKLMFQIGLAVLLGVFVYRYVGDVVPAKSLYLPFYKHPLELSYWAFVAITVLVITATSNAVNLTDGLDGLASGCVGICSVAFLVLTYIAGSEVWTGILNLLLCSMTRRQDRGFK